jgi:hypothetical protein
MKFCFKNPGLTFQAMAGLEKPFKSTTACFEWGGETSNGLRIGTGLGFRFGK